MRLGYWALVDTNRDSVWDVNVQRLRDWLNKIIRGEALPPEPALPKAIKIKRKRVGCSGP